MRLITAALFWITLSISSFAQPIQRIQLGYGLGYVVLQSPYGRAFFKEGNDVGWGHYTIAYPDKKIAVVILTNSENGEGIFKDILQVTIGDIYTPWYWENYIPWNQR